MGSVIDWLAPATAHETQSFDGVLEASRSKLYRWLGPWLSALSADAFVPVARVSGWSPVAGSRLDLIEAHRTAAAFLDALTRDRPVSPWLGEDTWVAHPNHRLGWIPTEVLLSERVRLEVGPRQVSAVRGYTRASVRSILPGGVGDALLVELAAETSLIVCADLSGPDPTSKFRCSVALGPRDGRWAVLSMPFLAIDLAWQAGVRATLDERTHVRLGHRFVFALALGQAGTLAALRNSTLSTLHIGTKVTTLDALVAQIAGEGPYFSRLATVVGSTHPVDAPGGASAEAVVAAVKARWRRHPRDFRVRWTRTEVGGLGGRPDGSHGAWLTMMVTGEAGSPSSTFKECVAGILPPTALRVG